jgi:hypothetical protein
MRNKFTILVENHKEDDMTPWYKGKVVPVLNELSTTP